jgi:ATP-dependent helicase HepA
VLDEAHQYDVNDPIYVALHAIAQTCYAMLALSATPSRGEATLLTALLSLVAPKAYSARDESRVTANLQSQRGIWDKLSITLDYLHALRQEDVLDAETFDFIAEEWESFDNRDPVIAEYLDRIKNRDLDAAYELVSYVQEFYRFDHRIIRTRRQTASAAGTEWSRRTHETIVYSASSSEVQLSEHVAALPNQGLDSMQLALKSLYLRYACTTPEKFIDLLDTRRKRIRNGESTNDTEFITALFSNPGPTDEYDLQLDVLRSAPSWPGELKWLETARNIAVEWAGEHSTSVPSRFKAAAEWVRSCLAAHSSHKVLVFSQEASVVEQFAAFIRDDLRKLTMLVETFHVERDERELTVAAQRFQREPGCRVLVSDELGGEGRNFQIATAVLHLDVPWFVGRIEQRIGRLDRVGRSTKTPVHSVIMLGPSLIEQAMFRLHADVFRVFDQSLGAIEFALPKIQRRVVSAALESVSSLENLALQLTDELKTEREASDKAFQAAMDASRNQMRDAKELAEILAEPDDGSELPELMVATAKELGITVREVRGGIFEFRWRSGELRRPLCGLPDESFYTGTFDRVTALADDSLHYFSATHKLVRALLDDLFASNEGRATIFARELGPQYRGKIFAIFLFRTSRNKHGEEQIHPGLRLRMNKYEWPEVVPAAVELILADKKCLSITEERLKRALSRAISERRDVKLAHSAPALNDIPNLVETLEVARQFAVELARAERTALVNEASTRLANELELECAYYRWAREHLDQEHAASAASNLEMRERMVQLIEREELEIESIAVVVGQ